jgi:subtilisin family serine protease
MLLVGLAGAPAYAVGSIRGADDPNAVPGSYIVVLKENTARPDIAAQATGLARQHGGRVDFVYDAALNGFSTTMSATAARRLAAHPAVDYVEQDIVATLEDDADVQYLPPALPWGLDRIDQRDLPLNEQANLRNTGANVNIYIIDTGVRLTHNEFGGRAFTGYDAVTPGGTAEDCAGHGTKVAGAAAGTKWGVAKQARIHSVRVTDCLGKGTTSQAVAGVNWVTANAVKPAVVNMSLGYMTSSTTLDQAVANSLHTGITYVAAAGNTDDDACVRTPARVPGVITVAATTSSDARADFSSWGSCVDIFAPGSNIYAATNVSDTSGGFTGGTSMASPYVAGAVAMILSQNPYWHHTKVRERLLTDVTMGRISSLKGSPNRLLYVGTAQTAPIPVYFGCDSWSSQYLCTVSYHSWVGPNNIRWRVNGTLITNWNNQGSVNGSCNSSTVVQVTVSNSAGSYSQSWSGCRSGLPL